MQLILVRHGEAAPALSDDFSRPLTPLGQQQAKSVAQQLLAQYSPDLLVVSPLLRAQQTLKAFTTVLPDVGVLQFDGIKPDDQAKPALEWLSNQPYQCIVVVCHMNIVAYMAGLLLGDHPEAFHLAEARVFEQVVIASGFSTEIARYLPKQE
jgi:phosphohistidine phosphatase